MTDPVVLLDQQGTAQREYRATLTQAAEAIRSAARCGETVALACHITPDGDALGSMLGLLHVLRSAGIDAMASFSEPFVIATHYRELVGLELISHPSSFPDTPNLMITFDCGSLGRLGDLEAPARAARELVVVDHHISNERYGTINVINADAAASGVVVRDLIAELGLPLNRESAVCLYAAIVCDTGRFQYQCTTPAVFELARELAEFDVPIPALSRTLFEEHRFAYLQLMATVLQRAVLIPEQRFVYAVVMQADLVKFDVTMEEVEGLIDMVRRTREAEVSSVLKQDADGTVRVSMRSLGDVDVCAIAQANGGGGHRFAAGFSSSDGIEATVARIRAAL